ncbi:MAG: hypothetical protein V4750_02780 [Pseudomonadota bacterium]
MELIAPLVGLLLVSLSGNAFLYILLSKSYKKPVETRTLTAEALLHDLTEGSALVRVERINPNDVFLRSPRQ